MELLDPRLVLSANPLDVDQGSARLAADIGIADIDIVGERVTFRSLSVATAGSDIVDDSLAFLTDYHQQLQLPADVADRLELVETKYGLASAHVRFAQVHEGLKVQNAMVSVHLDGAGNVTTIHNSFKDVAILTASEATIPVSQAIQAASAEAGIESTFADPKTELVWQVGKDGLTSLVWQVTVFGNNPTGDFLTMVDATTGEVQSQENRAAFATGSGDVYFPNPYQTQGNGVGMNDNNDQTSATLNNQLLGVTLEGLDNGTGLLRGEFVDTTFGGGLNVPAANESSRVYQYTRDDPRFEQVVVYHTVDQINRYFHDLGFDDDSGTPNGIRDFPTRANAHWYTQDQSFYSTGDDAIHFGDGGVDDAEDGDIIAHEYGHAVQHDQNSSWGGGEMGAMGEGFGDYLAASFFADSGNSAFQSNHAAAVGEWDATSYSGANPPNLRRVDGNKMYPTNLTGSVHADGEIWSAALWDIRSDLGGPTTDQLILESHFSLPGGALMPDAANAILQADQNLNGGANSTIIEQWFEDRGILGDLPPDDHGGNAATATPVQVNNTYAGVIEFGSDTDWFAFAVPAGANVTLETALGSLSDTTLALYDTNGTTLLAENDDVQCCTQLQSRIIWTAPATGTYYAVVGSYSTNVGSYTLSIDSDAVLLTGDFDGNGLYECADVDALVGEIVAASNNASFDLTGDGIVDRGDLDAWLLEAGEANFGPGRAYLPGDANLNGVVDTSDFNIFNANKFTETAAWCLADFNADGVTDTSDFNIFNSNRFTASLVVAGDDLGFQPGSSVENAVRLERNSEFDKLDTKATVELGDVAAAELDRSRSDLGQYRFQPLGSSWWPNRIATRGKDVQAVETRPIIDRVFANLSES